MILFSFVLFFGTVALCLASLRSKRGDAVGLPLVAIGSFLFLYGVQPLSVIESGGVDAFMTQGQFVWALLLPAIMLPCFVLGWNRERPRLQAKRRAHSNPVALWNFGFVTAIVGLCLYLLFLQRSGGILHALSQSHGGAMAWEENTAYLYDGSLWALSGAAMMMYASSGFKVTIWRRVAFALPIAAIFAQAFLTGGRGPLFQVCGTVFVGSSIAARKPPTMKLAFTILSVVGIGVLLMVGYRSVLHLGGDTQQAPPLRKALTALTGVSERDMARNNTGLEFLYHGAVLRTVDETHKYGLGLKWVYFVALNPIPRLLWPDKHYPESPGVTDYDMAATTGFSRPPGSMMGIVADLYAEFGVGEAIFLYWFGKLSKRLFDAAWRLQSPVAYCAYIMLYAFSLNVFTQNFGTILVAFGYSMIPVFLYALFSRIGQGRTYAVARTPGFSQFLKVPQI